jgi:hypothetical protein
MSLPDAPPEQSMAGTYLLVLVCHATVITLLWLFGRTFSRW